MAHSSSLVGVKPRPHTMFLSRGRTVLATEDDGWFHAGAGHGLFVDETRVLSAHEVLLDGERLRMVTTSAVEQHSSLGYYVHAPPGAHSRAGGGAGDMHEYTERTVEIRVSRTVGEGMHEDLDVTNYSQRTVSLELELVLEADFLDPMETERGPKQEGSVTRTWRDDGEGSRLVFDHQAEHTYDHQGDHGVARIHRAATVRLLRCDSPAREHDGRIAFHLELGPKQHWHCCLEVESFMDGVVLSPAHACYQFGGGDHPADQWRREWMRRSTRFSTTALPELATVAERALERARHDLASLMLDDVSTSADAWIPAAGVPLYIALFGRDTLITARQAMLTTSAIARGGLAELRKWQGTRVDDWRDEQPGRVLHEAHMGPLEVLQFNPRQRYYGSMGASFFYPLTLVDLWRWVGDEDVVRPFVRPALEALEWADQYGDFDHDGLYEFRTLSEQGVKNQDWRDSDDAYVYEDGSIVQDPIASPEDQALAYEAKAGMAELLGWLGRRSDAARLFAEAEALKKRFNERFWMPDRLYFCMGLDPHKRPIRSMASNTALALASGIIAEDRVRPVADRLMSDDLFSGWGVRTLAESHVAYDPYSYHRGSVWPAEQASIAAGFARYGLFEHLHRLAEAVFRAAAVFEFDRLPEVFSGHRRDPHHPFPTLYPQANTPQAWSASALFGIVQALTGIRAHAPLRLLTLDPHLPAWLPVLRLENLSVADATVTVSMWRESNGHTAYRVEDVRGKLHVARQPSPWSLTAGLGARTVAMLDTVRARRRRAPPIASSAAPG